MKEAVMVYSFQLWRHPNIHYREAILRLSVCELFAMLRSLSITAEIQAETLGSASFLTFECRPLAPEELAWLRGHSCVVFMAEKRGSMLFPLAVDPPDAIFTALPEVLKYKEKTNATFTQMMLNTAVSLTPFARQASLTLLDPLCGRGTGLFCGLLAGMNAVGLDLDGRDLKEAADYFSRFLRLHRVKHVLDQRSETVRSRPVPVRFFRFALSKEQFRTGETRSLALYEGDTSLAGSLMRKHPAHVLVADLPYGVQHAPQAGQKPESFECLLSRALPAWREALLPCGALALSFNSLTLKTAAVYDLLRQAGFLPVTSPAFSNLAHSVEQAVIRDLVFATVPRITQV